MDFSQASQASTGTVQHRCSTACTLASSHALAAKQRVAPFLNVSRFNLQADMEVLRVRVLHRLVTAHVGAE